MSVVPKKQSDFTHARGWLNGGGWCRLQRFRDQCAAMSVSGGDEAPGHVVAEERDGGGVTAVAHRERAAGFGAVPRIGERRLGAEGDLRQVDAVLRAEPGHGAGESCRLIVHQRAGRDGEGDVAGIRRVDFESFTVADRSRRVAGLLLGGRRIGDDDVAIVAWD